MAVSLETVPLLKCAICLDELEDGRRLGCDHCFCRTCLENYQRSNCHEGHLICPLCRRETELDEGLVKGLPTLDGSKCSTKLNTSILDHNGHFSDDVDDYGLEKLFESAPACTMCPDDVTGNEAGGSGARAVSFCRDCKEYMCHLCLSGHKRLSKLFSGHTLVSIQAALSEMSLTGADKCSEHNMETRNFFCEDCKTIVCQKCIFARHNIRSHTIRERADVELEIRHNIDALKVRVNEKKTDVQRYMKAIEEKRRTIKGILRNVFLEITEAHRTAVECLEERKAMLKESVSRVEHACDEGLDEIKKTVRCKSVSLTKSCEALERGRYGCLEGEALQSHIRLCKETETQLIENHETDGTERTLARLQRSAEVVRFTRVNARSVLGHVETTAPEVEQPLQINKLVSLGLLDDEVEKQMYGGEGDLVCMSINKYDDVSTPSRTFMNDIPVTKMIKPQPTFWCKRPWTLNKVCRFTYTGPTCMAVRTPESVVVGYWNDPAKEISLGAKGNTDFLPNYSANATSISFLQSGGIVMLYQNNSIAMFNPEGIPTGVRFSPTGLPWHLHTDENDDIFILTRSGRISIHHSTGGLPVRTISTRLRPLDIHAGSSCCVVRSETEVVVVSSDDGSDIWRMKTEDRQELQVAVDKESSILYVASSQRAPKGLHVCLRSFNLCDGSQLESCVLNVASGHLVAMKVMSPDMIAFCTSGAVYIFKKEDRL